jgi:quinoprotein glucose dehydrogenase
MTENENAGRPRYRWPYFLLAAVIVGVTLAVIWVAVIAKRIHEQRDNTMWPLNQPASPINGSITKTNAAATPAERMAEFRDTLRGGNAESGRKIFFESSAANCSKCHKAGGLGGENGPALDGIAARQSRESILESILFPNAVINTNFETIVVLLKSNSGKSGTLQKETDSELIINTPEDGPVTIPKNEIKERWKGVSPMPEGIWQTLSKQELRDVIEFVATLPASSSAVSSQRQQ